MGLHLLLSQLLLLPFLLFRFRLFPLLFLLLAPLELGECILAVEQSVGELVFEGVFFEVLLNAMLDQGDAQDVVD